MADDRKVLIDVASGKKTRFTISLDQYEANRYLHLREWYLDGTGQWAPGKRGVTLNSERYRALCQSIAASHAEIGAWVESSSGGPQADSTLGAANLADMLSFAATLKADAGRRTGAFFAVEHRGAEDTVTANTSHPFGEALAALDGDARDVVANLLAAFSRARETVGGADHGQAAVLLDSLELEWGRQLRAYATRNGSR